MNKGRRKKGKKRKDGRRVLLCSNNVERLKLIKPFLLLDNNLFFLKSKKFDKENSECNEMTDYEL